MKYFLMILLLFPVLSNAETYHLKVVYAGAIKNADKAIKDYEAKEYELDDYATLCALYTVKKDFFKAGDMCNKAVEEEGTFMAHNNRGVLRAHIGDLTGAMQDFDIVRISPEYRDQYVQEIIARDVRIVATSNYSVIRRLQDKRKAPQIEVKSKAEPEEL